MSAAVLNFPGLTTLDISPVKVLETAAAQNLDAVLVLGNAGTELFAAGSTSDVAAVLLMVERFKQKLLAGDYGDLVKPA